MDGILVHNPRHAREWWGVLRDSRGDILLVFLLFKRYGG
ncbi:hypothetical protein V6Z11_D03G053200 [Gossypium hirsutum]